MKLHFENLKGVVRMARIIVVGSGVVGQATGKGLTKKGHEVVFVDVNAETVRRLREEGHEAYLTCDLPDIDAKITMFCVPTPSENDGRVNLDYITTAVADHGKWLGRRKENSWHLIVVRSTVPPWTTRRVLLPVLEKNSGLKAGKDFGMCMQPEFLRAKSSEEDFLNPWATVIGQLDTRSGDALEKVYANFCGRKFRVDLEVAEFEKYVHNCFNAVKISFSNEIWMAGNEMGIDANSALEIATVTTEGLWNPGYGMVGGRPYGGTCLPKDTKGLEMAAKDLGISMSMLTTCIAVNEKMEELAAKGIVELAAISGPKWQPSPSLKEKGY